MSADLERSAIPEPCHRCRGLEYVIIHIAQRGISGAARCTCQRGQWLARKDREGRGDSWQPDRSGERCAQQADWQPSASFWGEESESRTERIQRKVAESGGVHGLPTVTVTRQHAENIAALRLREVGSLVPFCPPITQADIDRAAAERKSKAAGE